MMKTRIFYFFCILLFSSAPLAFAQPAEVWETGQKQCYDASGNVIDCATLGQTQDGAVQAGVAWPDPRFQVTYCNAFGPCGDQGSDCDLDSSNDVVYDSLTDLIWTRDANLPGNRAALQGCLNYVDTLNSGGLCGYYDWRLPNRKELFSLLDFSQHHPALQSGNPFVNVQSDNYWSSTTGAYNPIAAWYVSMTYGSISGNSKSTNCYLWPVRSVNSDVSVTKSDSPDPVFKNGQITYTVNVANDGPDTGTGVTLTDTLPGGVTFVSANSTQGTCAEAGGIVTCNIGDMVAAADVTVTIVVTAPGTEGAITNSANVTSAIADPDITNNSATEQTTVSQPKTSLCYYLGGPNGCDINIFTFTGAESEDVHILLEADPQGSHTGDTATLTLYTAGHRMKTKLNFFRDENVLDKDSSALPSEITTTLPSAGLYYMYIYVDTHRWGGGDFVGDYCLTLESSGNAWDTFMLINSSQRCPVF